MPDAKANMVNSVRSSVEAILSPSLDRILRHDLSGHHFASFEEVIVSTQELVRSFRDAGYEQLPYRVLQLAATPLEKFASIISAVVTLNPASDHRWLDRMHRLEQSMEEINRNLVTELLGPLTLAIATSPKATVSGIEDTLAQVRRRDQESAESFAEQIDRLKQTTTSAEEILGRLREKAGKESVKEHATAFGGAADDHDKQASWWLASLVVVGVVIVGLAIVNLAYVIPRGMLDPQGVDTGTGSGSSYGLQIALGKVLLLSVLLTIAISINRVYRAHRHNSVVNRHRANALNGFDAFVIAASGDEQAKSAVLIQATQAIFTPQATGYLSDEPDSAGPARILELYRTIGGGSKPST